MPLVRVGQIDLIKEAALQMLKDRCKALDPLGNGDMRNMNLMDRRKQLRGLTHGDIGHEVVVEGSDYDMKRMSHPLHGKSVPHQC